MPGGLRHGLGDPTGWVDLTMYREREPNRQSLVAPLVLVVAGFDETQQFIRGLRGYLLAAELTQRGDHTVHQDALQAGGADVEAEDGALIACDAVAATIDAALGEILITVTDAPLGHQLVEDLANRRNGQPAVTGQGGFARLLESVEQC
ncbi:hypothetical protein D3C73_1202000 [compost metagenome]